MTPHEQVIEEVVLALDYMSNGGYSAKFLAKSAAALVAQIAPLLTADAEARERQAVLDERERCAKICHQQAAIFGSVEYATGQPLSSFKERFACETIAAAILTGVKP